MSDTCRSCGADVRFVPSAKSGKAMILNAQPEKRLVLVVADDGRPPHPAGPLTLATNPREIDPSVIEHYRARMVDTYVDHHATCPAAKKWKGRHR